MARADDDGPSGGPEGAPEGLDVGGLPQGVHAWEVRAGDVQRARARAPVTAQAPEVASTRTGVCSRAGFGVSCTCMSL